MYDSRSLLPRLFLVVNAGCSRKCYFVTFGLLLEVLVGECSEQAAMALLNVWELAAVALTVTDHLRKCYAVTGRTTAGGAGGQVLGAGSDGGHGRRGAGCHASPPTAL